MVVFSNILKEEATLRPRPIPQGPFQCDSEVASPIDMAAAEGGLGAGRPLAPESSLLRHQEATLLWPWALSNFCSRLQIFFFTLASHLLMKAQLPFSVSETTLTVLESEVMAGEGGTTFWVPTVLAGRSGAP